MLQAWSALFHKFLIRSSSLGICDCMPPTNQLKGSKQALDILWRRFEETKTRNPQFSLRAYAQRLGVSSGALSEILKGKRALSHSVKQRVAAKLLLSPKETLDFFQNDLPAQMSVAADDRLILSQDQFHLISDWWYFGLLNLLKTRGFKNQISWMARRLGLTTQIITDAWDRLFRLGYLEMKNSKVVRKQSNLKTTDNLKDISIRKAHLADLSLIEKSLADLPYQLRDNTSCTFVIDKKDLAKAKEMIRIFQNQFLNEIGKDTGDEVYKMSIALFPITQVTGEQ